MTAPHDPGEPGPHLDPMVSRVVYDLRDAGIRTQPEAIHAIAAREGAGLNPGQIAKVLWQFTAPEPAEPERRRALCEVCLNEVVETGPGWWEHATAEDWVHAAQPRADPAAVDGLRPVGPAYEPPGQRDDD